MLVCDPKTKIATSDESLAAIFFVKNKNRFLPGNDLLSQRCVPPVPSALAGLTTGFGMGPGVSPPLKSPEESVLD